MSTLIQYEPFVDSTTELFLSQTEKLYAKTGEACNFSRWLQFYAFDVIGEMTYSKRHGFLEENRDIDGIIDYVANLFDYAGPVNPLSPVPFPTNFKTDIDASLDRPNPFPRCSDPQKSHLATPRKIRIRRWHLPRRKIRPRPHA
jgi:hypothetical protein